MNMEPSIFADTETTKTVFVRVEGKGSFENSPSLKAFAVGMLGDGRREFVVDLKNCPSMDSTFMGTLAGIAQRLDELGGGNLWVVNRNTRNTELLGDLGITVLFSDATPPELPVCAAAIEAAPADKATTRTVMREAHEACVKANPENAEKFKDVLEYLADSERRGK